jgi:tetratricopeptide (TPR) repeat protein
MDAQQQGQQPKQGYRGFTWKSVRRIIYILISISVVLFILGAVIYILSAVGTIHGDWVNKLFTILVGLGLGAIAFIALLGIFQFILSLIPDESKVARPPPATPATLAPAPDPAASPPTPHGIAGFPPPTDPRTIQQRERAVQDIYSKLTQPGISAVILTGIGGQGKSTLAALVYRYAEAQQRAGHSYFTGSPLWLRIDPVVTLADILTNVCDALGVRAPDLASLSPQNQAVALFNSLNSVDQPRLVVLDQFENVLDDEGRARDDRPGIGEWLDTLNSNACACRVLLTSRPDPQGTRDYPATCLLTYPVEGLSEAEGMELLRKWQVNATEAEMRTAVKRCNGHAMSLTLLASRIQKRRLTLAALLNDPQYAQLWKGDIAENLLNEIYQDLDSIQRKLLAAFSVYREPIPVEAAVAVASDAAITRNQADATIDTLLAQHLLDAKGDGSYQPHAIVAEYARDHLVARDEQANHQALLAPHASAAHYYLERAKTTCPPRDKRRKVSDVHDLIETMWQYCIAEQWQDAYELMEEEHIFDDVNRWGGNTILLELYQLLEAGNQRLEPMQQARIAYCLGWIYDDLGRKQEALRYYEQALAICREVGDRGGEGATLNNLGLVYDALGQQQEALRYFEQALAVCREVGDRAGEGTTLHNIGTIYYKQNTYDVALACFLLARSIYEEVQSPNRDKVQEWIDGLRNKVGEERYKALLAQVEPRAGEIVEQALREGGML